MGWIVKDCGPGRLVRAARGRDQVVEEILLQGRNGGGREGFAAGGGGDDGEELEFGEGGAGDVDTLGVGAGVGRGEMEADVVDQVVEKGDVRGSEAFQEVSGAKGHAEPESLGARPGKEGTSGKAFGVDSIVEIELADITDVFDVVEKKGNDSSGKVEQVDRAIADEGCEGQVPRESFAGEATDDHLFVGGGHRSRGLSHGRGGEE
jgi:hypothetical protein